MIPCLPHNSRGKNNKHTQNQWTNKVPSPKINKKWVSWLPYIALPLILYFGNVELQTYLGKKALSQVDLAHLSFEEALIKAKAEDKQVLIDMSAIWCPACRKLDTQVLSIDAVKKAIEKDYIFARIEYESDAGKSFMAKYHVNGFPTLLILDDQGNKIRKLPLTFSPEQFISSI